MVFPKIKKLNNSNILLVSLILTVILLLRDYYLNYSIRWKNPDAVYKLKQLKNKYGSPSISDYSEGGIAMWKKDKLAGTCFEQIIILDESVPHCVPSPHRDFMYTYVKYEIPSDKVLDVLSLSGSVAYDPLKKLLSARCASEEANIATLYVATAIGNSKMTITEVHRDKTYGKTINSTGDPQTAQMLYNKLCKALENQPGNPDWTGYFPLAFPEGCCDGYDPNTNTCGDGKIQGSCGTIEATVATSDKAAKAQSDKPQSLPVNMSSSSYSMGGGGELSTYPTYSTYSTSSHCNTMKTSSHCNTMKTSSHCNTMKTSSSHSDKP